MEWEVYKTHVDGSRRLIVYPFFEKHLSHKEGVGVDVGCGNGDLTAHIDQVSSGSVVGIDKDQKSLEQARVRHNALHFVCGEIDKNALPTLGITFDFAFSNCCFCHISDEGIYNVLFDLHSCMKDSAELVYLVPSIAWAKSMYSDVEFERSGITAVPRYGGRQFFRTSEWYLSALHKCGFEIVSSEEITIPDDDSLEDRYRNNVGEKLFSAFVARRIENLPNSKSMKEAFEIAHDNRKLEIQLFWQRSLFFWGFVAAALVGYGTVYNDKTEIEIVFALFGLVCSVVWSSGNRGSKYWQEYWEQKVTFFQHYTTGNIFYDRSPKAPGFLEVFAPRRMSVSKLTMALSDYSVFLWLLLCAHSIVRSFRNAPSGVFQLIGVLTLLTLSYCLWFLNKSKSED
jgi:SAM-dependent methyltransferase